MGYPCPLRSPRVNQVFYRKKKGKPKNYKGSPWVSLMVYDLFLGGYGKFLCYLVQPW